MHDRNLCASEISGILPGTVPCGFVETVVGFTDASLILQCQSQVVDRLSVVRVGVALLPYFHGGAEVLFRFGEASFADIPQAQGIVVAYVQRVAAQGFLVIVHRIVGGVAVLFQVQSREVELFGSLDFFGEQSGFGCIGDGFHFIRFGVPVQHFTSFGSNAQAQAVEAFAFRAYRFIQELFGSEGHLLVVIDFPVFPFQGHAHFLTRSGEYLEVYVPFAFRVDVHQQVLGGVFHDAQFAVGEEVLGEAFLFIRLEPRKVGLVLGIHPCHQFDVRSVLIGQVAVPGTSEVSVTPCPLLLARRYMVACHVKHAGAGIVLITAFEVEARVDSHVRGGYLDVLVVRDVNSCRIVHLVIRARGDRETRYGTFPVVEHRIDVGREHALVMVVHRYGRVCPPQEGLGHIGAVIKHAFDFEVSASRTQGEACHAFLVEHPFHLAYPYRYASVGILFDGAIYRHIRAGAVVLRPVEFDAARNPRSGKPYQSGLDDMVVIDKVAFLDFIVCHLYASAQFGEHHDLDVLVLQINRMIGLVGLLVGNGFDDRVGINHAAASLIDTFLQKYRVLFGFPHFVGRDNHIFFPSFYHNRM